MARSPTTSNATELPWATKRNYLRVMPMQPEAFRLSHPGSPYSPAAISKLTPQEVEKIRKLHAQGVEPSALAARFGVSIEIIRRILTKRDD